MQEISLGFFFSCWTVIHLIPANGQSAENSAKWHTPSSNEKSEKIETNYVESFASERFIRKLWQDTG